MISDHRVWLGQTALIHLKECHMVDGPSTHKLCM